MPIVFTLQLGRQVFNMQAARNFYIAPSILSADFARLGEEVDAVVAADSRPDHARHSDTRFPAIIRTQGASATSQYTDHGYLHRPGRSSSTSGE